MEDGVIHTQIILGPVLTERVTCWPAQIIRALLEMER
jgi:hypothetical protein